MYLTTIAIVSYDVLKVMLVMVGSYSDGKRRKYGQTFVITSVKENYSSIS